MEEEIEIFISYAHEDELLRQQLEKRLRSLKRDGSINVWHDREIRAGTEWKREIDTHLNTAKAILLLVSPDFIDSDYCYSIEMLRAMERHELGEARVIPVILRPVYWQKTPFGKLQALPTEAKPITSRSWHDLDEAFFDLEIGIRNTIEELIKAKGNSPVLQQVESLAPTEILTPEQMANFQARRGQRDFEFELAQKGPRNQAHPSKEANSSGVSKAFDNDPLGLWSN